MSCSDTPCGDQSLGVEEVCITAFPYMYKILYFPLFLQHIPSGNKICYGLYTLILTPDANTARPVSHTNGTTFRRTNCQLRLKRSGMPSRLSLRRQWIPSPLKAFLTVCFGRGGGLYLLFTVNNCYLFRNFCPFLKYCQYPL